MARPAADRDLMRTRILDAAEHLLGTVGYRGMTIDNLAASAGLSKGAVYLHFESKEEIAVARIDRVIDELLVELQRLAATDRPAPERLRAMLLERILFRIRRVRAYRDAMDDIVSSIRPRLVVARREHHRKEAATFAAVVRDGMRRAEIRACRAARVGEAMVLATNALLPADLRPDEMDEAHVRSRVASIADLLLHGLVVRKGT